MLVSTHEDGCATRAAARCPALSDSSTWMPGMRVFDCHTVICYTKSSGNQNLTAVPALLGLQGILQSATCDNSAPAALQRTPPEVSASDSHLHDSAPVGWLRGEGKLLSSKTWQLAQLANGRAPSWQGTGCAPTCEPAASARQAGCSTMHPTTSSHMLFSEPRQLMQLLRSKSLC